MVEAAAAEAVEVVEAEVAEEDGHCVIQTHCIVSYMVSVLVIQLCKVHIL